MRLLVETRRRLHRYPELGHAETDTAALVEEWLRGMSLHEVFRPSQTSIAALTAPADHPLIVLRADLDGLPIDEATQLPHASARPGAMHACGHDGHTAALLAVAELLSRDGTPSKPVLLVFQQAEESHPSGAPLVLDGLRARLGAALDRATFYGFHLWPHLPEHQVGVREGPVMGGVTGVTVRLADALGSPEGMHAQRDKPDALAGAVRLYERLEPIRRGRRLDAGMPATFHVGRMGGGERPQDVAPTAELRGTLRFVDSTAEADAKDVLRRALEEVATELGLDGEAEFEDAIRPPLTNDSRPVELIRAVCTNADIECVDYPSTPLGVSEDFGWYLSAGDGAYFLLGCGSAGHRHELHDPRFDFDERVLLSAVAVLAGLAGVEPFVESPIAPGTAGDS